MLRVEGVEVGYGGVPALHGVDLAVASGQVVAVVGSNGAGKSTLLRTISGLLQPTAGSIAFGGERIDRRPAHRIVRLGIAHVPEGRHLFPNLTVHQNLLLGAFTRRDPTARARTLARVYELFPILRERAGQRAGTLSGGEQQMCAIGRGLMLEPKLLMLDEPSLGIAPKIVAQIFEVIRAIAQAGVTILLVEQNVQEALELADRAYVLQTGRIVLEGSGAELLRSDLVRRAYLGL